MTGRRSSLPLARARGRLQRGDWIAVALLVIVPILLYAPLAIAGHPVLPGDDLTQNYPLRVLSGSILLSGHLPLWNPLMWSGTPLLAGWNAGSLYPGTMLFALFPAIAAWTINLVLVYVVAGVGSYALLRVLHCGPLAAVVGASCFSYTGFMSGQLAHIGLVEGSGYLPWMLLGIELVIVAPSFRSATMPMLLVGLSSGLCILAGEPRAVSSAVIVCSVYAFCRLMSLHRRQAWRAFGMMLAAAALGTGLAAIQWVPGLTFIASSQRSLNAYSAFNAGSLSWSNIARDMLVPFLLGGNHNFGLPTYLGSYNLPEITVGVGLLPLVAAAWFLPELGERAIAVLRRVDRAVGARSRIRAGFGAPEHVLGVWYVMATMGFVLTLGGTTPIGRILIRIPLYGGERLQNRNAVIFDLALSVLLAFFLEDLTHRTSKALHAAGRRSHAFKRRVRVGLALGPLLGCCIVLAQTRGNVVAIERRLGVQAPSPELFSRLGPYFLWTLALAVVIAAYLATARLWSRRSSVIALAVLAVCDIGTYAANTSFAGVEVAALDARNSPTQLLKSMAGSHRVGLYNPFVLLPTPSTATQVVLAEPDVNVIQGLASIQGYGSIVSGAYQTATSTHNFEGLDLTVLRNGLENSLNLGVLLTLPAYLDVVLSAKAAIPLAGGGAVFDDGSPGVVTPTSAAGSREPTPSGPWAITPRTSGTWWLPKLSRLTRLTVVTTPTAGHPDSRLRIGLSSPGNATRHYDLTMSGRIGHLSFGAGVSADEVSIENQASSSVVVAAVVADRVAQSDRLLLDGSLQGWLPASQWNQFTQIGPYVVFVNEHALGTAWIQPKDSLTPTGEVASVGTVRDIVAPLSGGQVMDVSANQAALLIRSLAWAPGWKARITPTNGGPSRVVSVGQLGLVEAISVPAGASRVRWYYAPPGVIGSGIVSIASGGLMLALFLVSLLRIHRRRRHPAQLSYLVASGEEV